MVETFDILAVTGCTTGIAHTYMAKEAFERAAASRDLSICVETHGQVGVEHRLTASQIEAAQGIVIAADKPVELDRFTGKPMVSVAISKALSIAAAGELIDHVLSLGKINEVVTPQGEGDELQVTTNPDDFVQPEQVFITQGLGTKDALLEFVSSKAVELGFATDASELKEAFLSREGDGTTGVREGFAIPHAKCASVTKPSVIVVKDSQGFEGWESMDGTTVNTAIAILVPAKKAGLAHLKMLSRIAEALMDDQFRSSVRGSQSTAQIASLVSARLA